ncbi:Glycosyltransferase involved in cell wall bisynthesis [Actinomyces ruminicola]|uniref:Glycosyltransferase involved in cell wall bisynthesis n=2 Tax=Actinomyces ruminicola TaxID=332524 RepID=A0A1G9TVG4_9ACTO|nr:Glycosyltransferase involved in cell wall bisynthesis [Actinomyces ruminicola]
MSNAQRGDGVGAPLRVLHINSSISRRSGVMSVVMNYFRNMDRSRVVFDFCYYAADGGPDYEEEILGLGGRCLPLGAGRHALRIRSRLAALLAGNPGEYVIAHLHDPALTRLIHPVVRGHGVNTLIVHSHATEYSDHMYGRFRNRLACRRIADHCEAQFACSRAAGEFLFGSDGFELIPNAVDVNTYGFQPKVRSAARIRLGLTGAFVVGHVGRFSPQKNHRSLIPIFNEICRMRGDARLLLVGDGPLRTTVEKQVAELGLDGRVDFLGNRLDVPELYQAMDVMVLPSLYEGLPMVGVEAQCSGLPLVCADTVSREVGIGDCSFLSLNASPGEWAREVGRLTTGARPRATGPERIRAAGYDVEIAAAGLADKYWNLAGS